MNRTELIDVFETLGLTDDDNMSFWLTLEDGTEVEIDLYGVEKRMDGSCYVNFEKAT